MHRRRNLGVRPVAVALDLAPPPQFPVPPFFSQSKFPFASITYQVWTDKAGAVPAGPALPLLVHHGCRISWPGV
jgi:hypothetical protein